MPSPRLSYRRNAVRLEGSSKQTLEVARNRLVLAAALFALAFLAISGRIVDLTVFKYSEEPPTFAKANSGEAVAQGRADIVDRNGIVLATSISTASLYAEPNKLLNVSEAVEKLRRVFPDYNAKILTEKLNSKKQFVWIKRHLTPREQFQVNALGIPGLNFQKDVRRIYPFGNLFSHTVGYTDVDNQGLGGVEKYFDNKLRTDNKPFRLSLDARVQHIIKDELKKTMDKHSAKGGAAVVMNVQNGELLAMVSAPDFDPNNPNKTPSQNLFNQVSLGVYEMGSTFKIFNTALALDSKVLSLSDGFETKEPIKIAGGYTIRDFKPQGRWLSVPEIFMHSSNIGSAKMAMMVGTKRQQEFLKKLGLLNPSTVELTEVGSPHWPRTWRDVNTMTIAFGHGISVSPIQLCAAVSAMINGGVLHPATLLAFDEKTAANGTQVVSAETSATIRRLLRLVVEKGTGGHANAAGYVVGGKTGSAEKSGAGGYQKKSLLSSFLGVFPMNDPQYVVFMMLDEPSATKDTYGYATGGWVAAPAVGKAIARIAPILHIDPVGADDREIARALSINLYSKGVRGGAAF